MKYCDDCKWCSVNFKPTKAEVNRYGCPKIEKKDGRFYTCMHPAASKGVRFDCNFCTTMRLNSSACKQEALLFKAMEAEE